MALPRFVKESLQFLLFTGAGVLILYFLFKSQQNAYLAECALKGIPAEECSLIDKLANDFASVDYGWIAIIVSAYIFSNIIRAHRWLLLIETMGVKGRMANSFFTIMVGYLANMGLPRIGEVVRAGLFARYEKIGVEKAIGTIVVDRVLDLASLLFAIILTLILQGKVLFEFFSHRFGNSILSSVWFYVGLILFIVAVIVLWRQRRWIKRISLYQKIQHLVDGFRDGLRSLRRVEKPWLIVFETAAIWIMYYLMMFLAFKAFVPTEHLGGMAGLMVFVFGGLGIVFPSPGGMGTFHAMVIAALAIYGIAGDDAFSFANIQFFSIQLLGTVLFGIIGLIVLPLINKSGKNENITSSDSIENS